MPEESILQGKKREKEKQDSKGATKKSNAKEKEEKRENTPCSNMEVDEKNDNSENNNTPIEIEDEKTVFKVPTKLMKPISKKENKVNVKKEISTVKNNSNSSEENSNLKPQLSDPSENATFNEKRTLVSFRPKAMTLPSQVYKPHRPTASEYIKRYAKAESNEGTIKDKDIPKEISFAVKPEDKLKRTPAKQPPPKLKYDKPSWSSPSEDVESKSYSLEVLKAGTIIDKISLTNNEYFVFGRLADCDITLEHPSISRHHAILQFGSPCENDNVEFQKDGSCGFYLYDLGSTHGSYLNKSLVPSEKYYRVKVGHMMKFGGSSRIYILQGPCDDEEEEAKETATELLEKTRNNRTKKDLAKMMMGDDSDSDEDNIENTSSYRKRTEDTDNGITWGMLEEAVVESDEEEEKEKEEEQTFLLQDKKDPFYVKDPHKALRNFYEKEGMEIEFECTERRPGQWSVRLELPIDTPTGKAVVAEASLTGKKKDAMNNCALEACRLLEKYGMFKQSEHHRRKVKQWEKEDFYDSDEDQYWDRTGELEKKRRQRKLRVGVKKKSSSDEPQTYESLKKQIDDLEKEVAEIEKQLDKDKEATRSKQGVQDPLEEFMLQVKSGKTLDSITRSKMKQRLFQARKESARLIKLAEIARPASLPPLHKDASKSMSFIGRMKGKKKGLLVPSTIPPPPTIQPIAIEDNNIVEEDEDVSTPTANVKVSPSENKDPTNSKEDSKEDFCSSSAKEPDDSVLIANSSSLCESMSEECKITKRVTKTSNEDLIPPSEENTEHTVMPSSSNLTIGESAKRKRAFGPTLPADLKERLLGGESSTSDDANGEKKKRKRNRKKSETPKTVICSSDPDYADWMPPDDQSGDGTTSLNAKFGY